ncbi:MULTISPECIES: response regulator [Shimia]|uniref:response regulator n=1 Tax=Shimia TaxID=573139 RepID=UPI001FB3517E|nr:MULTISPECIES: response regulator [Shimia]MDV4143579.1 response regulator [Shimia sp. FJ5]
MPDLKRVVHIDDEPDIREIVRMSLALVGGLEVEQYPSGEEALSHIADVNPDLVLLDVMMPNMDGEETYQHIREIDSLKDIPIVFMTAKASNADLAKLRDLGAIDVLIKPFDPMTLADQVKAIYRDAKAA